MIDQIERKSLNDDFLDVYDTVYIPICRRLYRRVGPRFDVIKMIDKLFEELSNNFNTLKADIESERNEKLSQKDPVVNFCINFSDSYEDEETLKSLLSTEDYEIRVDFILQRVRDVLLNNRNVLSFKKNDVDWDIKLSEEERSILHVRFWNQNV